MKLKSVLVFNAVAALVFGIGFVLIPAKVGGLYGITQTPDVTFVGQLFGVELVGIGLICWLIRNIADPGFQRAIIISLLISDIVGAIVSVLGITSGVMNAVGWSSVAIYLLLVFGYGYFLFAKPRPA
ncbi:MAG: hypothetical protein WBM09_11900 [Gallionella sp.]